MSELGHTNSIYSSLSESSPAMGGRQGGNNNTSFPLEHSLLPSQDQFHDIRSSSPYGLPQSPGLLHALPRHQPLVSSLGYPESGLSVMPQSGGAGINPAVRGSIGAANGPSSDLSTGSSGGYPDFPASPASWLDEVDHGQFWLVHWDSSHLLAFFSVSVFCWVRQGAKQLPLSTLKAYQEFFLSQHHVSDTTISFSWNRNHRLRRFGYLVFCCRHLAPLLFYWPQHVQTNPVQQSESWNVWLLPNVYIYKYKWFIIVETLFLYKPLVEHAEEPEHEDFVHCWAGI